MKNEIRVVHIVPALFGQREGRIGGAERYVFELARHMSDEVSTTLVSFGSNERCEMIGRLRLRVIGRPWYVRSQHTNPMAFSVLRELREADVVHCHQQHLLISSFAALVCRLSGRRVFVSDFGGGGWDVSAYISTDRWYHGHLHISEYSRQVAGHSDKAWAHVILGGIDTRKFAPGESGRRREKVLFVGRLLPHKGVNHLVDAVPADVPLEIIGPPTDPRFAAELQAQAGGKAVTFRHDCNDDELVAAYREAMCVVLPSVYKTACGEETRVPELLGLSLLEAMACGTPVIGTGVASLREVVEDGITGFIVPPNDAESLRARIVWLREHQEEAARMGQAARRRVLEKFTWPAVVRRCLEVYTNGWRSAVTSEPRE